MPEHEQKNPWEMDWTNPVVGPPQAQEPVAVADPLEGLIDDSPFQFIQPTDAKEDVSIVSAIPKLSKRIAFRFLRDVVETNLPTKEERMGFLSQVLGAPLRSPTIKSAIPQLIEPAREIIEAIPETPPEKLAFAQRAFQSIIPNTPPETSMEKVADTIGGLGAFIARLSVLNRAGAIPLRSIPRGLRAPIIWETENQLAGGPTGEGAAMALGLAGVAALPIRTGLKIGLESTGFGSLSAIHGADEVDIYIAMAIPPALRGIHGMRVSLAETMRKARTPEELKDAVEKVDGVAAKVKKDGGLPEDHKPTIEDINESLREYTAELTPEQIKQRVKDIKGFRESLFAPKKKKSTKKEDTEPPIIRPSTIVPGERIPASPESLERFLQERGVKKLPIEPSKVESSEQLQEIAGKIGPGGKTTGPAFSPGQKIRIKNPVPAPKDSLINEVQIGDTFTFNVGEKRFSGPETARPASITSVNRTKDGRVLDITFDVKGEDFPFRLSGKNFHDIFLTEGGSISDLKGGGVVGKISPVSKPVRVIKPTAPAAPTVITRVGPNLDPVVTGDTIRPIFFNRARPKVYDSVEQFKKDFNEGLTVIPKKVRDAVKDPNDPKQLFDFMVKDKRIKLSSSVPKPKEVPVSQTVTGDLPVEKRLPTEVELETAVENARLLEVQSDAIQRLPSHQRFIMEGLRGLNNRPRKSYAEIAEALDVTEQQVAWLENQAILSIQKALGVEPPNATQESSNIQTDPYPHRRGLLTLPPAGKALEILGIIPRLISDFVSLESRSMTQNVRRHGSKGDETADFMNVVIDQQLAYLGALQPNQVKAQARLNNPALNRAGFNMQHRGFATSVKSKDGTEVFVDSTVLDVDGKPLLVAGENWVVDPIVDIVQGRISPKNNAERDIAQIAARTPAMETAGLLESVGLQISVKGKSISFKGTPEGKVFLAMSTQAMHDILIRGPGRKDLLWEAIEDGNMALNGITRGEARTKLLGIQSIVVESYSQTGYKHIGPELARAFPRRPSAVRGRNGRRVQIEVTNPRKYMDSVYTTSAIRAGFVQYFGQDGKAIQKLKEDYVNANGKPLVFDNAIRAMSDVPPLMFGRASISALRSPSSPEYNFLRGTAAALEVAKQGLLSSTAPIQLSEPIAFGPQAGFGPMIRGMSKAVPFTASKKVVMDELVSSRAITEDVINLTIDRAHTKTSIVNNWFAGTMSRLHLNKFANELANERVAGLQGWARIGEIAARGKRGEPVRERDILYLHGLLEYPVEVAQRLASGRGTVEEYRAAVRRAVRQSVGSTAIRSQKSPLQNTRAYGFMIPFTRFFSNRIRTFDLLYQSAVESGKVMHDNPTPRNWKVFLLSTHNLSKFMVFATFAGTVAAYIQALLREGPDGVEQKNRELENKPTQFFRDNFAWGTFGPVYGAFYQGLFEGTDSEESSEIIFKKMGRMMFPASETIDLYDALFSKGQFRNMNGGERLSQFIKMHLPIMQTLPGQHVSNLLGMQLGDPKTEAATKAYWRWRFNASNNSVPSHGGTPASRTAEDRQSGIHLRRAFKAFDSGRDPIPHMLRAFESVDAAIDMKSIILNKTLLDKPGLNDEKRREMERVIGSERMQILRERDFMYRLFAEQADSIFGFGKDIKKQKTQLENIELEATTVRP